MVIRPQNSASAVSPNGTTLRELAVRNARTVVARSYVRIVGANRETSWLIGDTFLPFLMISAYVFVYKMYDSPKEFVGYVVLGGAMSAYWVAVLWSMAMQLYWEKQMGNLELYTMAPMSMMSILAGMAIGGLFMTTIRAGAILLGGIFIFDVDLNFTQPWLAFGTVFLTLIALYGMGLMFSSIFFLTGRRGWHVMELLHEPIFFASGFYFPVKALGAVVPLITSIIPITLGLDAIRQLAFPSNTEMGFLPPKVELAALCGLAFIFLFVAAFLLKWMEKKGRETGWILQRWQ